MLHIALAPISLSLLGLPIVQEGVPAVAAPAQATPATEAVAALRALVGRDLVFEGEAIFEEAEKDEDAFGGTFAFVQVMGGSPFGGAPFVGALELVLRKEGDMLLCSDRAAPGFVTYGDGELTLQRVTYAKSPPSLHPVVTELMQLLDLERLAAEVALAEVTRQEAGERLIYAGTLRNAYVLPPAAAEDDPFGISFGGMEAAIMKLGFRLVLDGERACERLEFTVTRSDPTAAFMADMEIVELDDVGEVVEVAVDDGPDGVEPVEGGTSTYTFHVLDMAPTERAQKALVELRAVARELKLSGR